MMKPDSSSPLPPPLPACALPQRRRAKLLLLAYACSPSHGSDEAVGWNWALQAARFADTWVLCEKSQYEGLVEDYFRKHGRPQGLNFVFVEKPRWMRALGRIPGFYYLTYNWWHRRAFRAAQRLHREHRFDAVHQLNYCGYREPGYLWKLDAPFLWGPIGGTQNVPWRFLPTLSLSSAVSEALRGTLNQLQLRLSRRVRNAAGRAAVLMTANSTVQRDFRRVHGVDSLLLCEVQLPKLAGRIRRAEDRGDTLRLLWSGLFHEFKGLGLLLQALALLPSETRWHLNVVGDGRSRHRWMSMAARLGLIDRITWHGWLPRSAALEHCRRADVFVFTSLRDTTGTVILEALAAGAPVVCLDHQGGRDIVTDQCGIKVPATRPEETVAQLSDAIAALARDAERLEALSRGALARAAEYMPAARDGVYVDVLRRVLADGFDWGPRSAAEFGSHRRGATDDPRRGNIGFVDRADSAENVPGVSCDCEEGDCSSNRPGDFGESVPGEPGAASCESTTCGRGGG